MRKFTTALTLSTGLSLSVYAGPKPVPDFHSVGETQAHANGSAHTATFKMELGTPTSNAVLEKLIVVPQRMPKALNASWLPSGELEQRDTRQLLRSGYRSNPTFQYKLFLRKDSDGSVFASCGGTLVGEKDGICVAATASHCLIDAARRNPKVPYYDDLFAYLGTVEMNSAHWGTHWATAFISQYYAEWGMQDVGVLAWRCEGRKGALLTEPTRKPVKFSERVYYGKVQPGTGNQQGFYEGVSYAHPNVAKVNSIQVGQVDMDIYPKGPGCEMGDSGSGAFRYTTTTQNGSG